MCRSARSCSRSRADEGATLEPGHRCRKCTGDDVKAVIGTSIDAEKSSGSSLMTAIASFCGSDKSQHSETESSLSPQRGASQRAAVKLERSFSMRNLRSSSTDHAPLTFTPHYPHRDAVNGFVPGISVDTSSSTRAGITSLSSAPSKKNSERLLSTSNDFCQRQTDLSYAILPDRSALKTAASLSERYRMLLNAEWDSRQSMKKKTMTTAAAAAASGRKVSLSNSTGQSPPRRQPDFVLYI